MAPWTPHEDELLLQQIDLHGTKDQWRKISEAIPGRSNKACRKRWLHSLNPDVKKTLWTREEDELLLKLHYDFPGRWAIIARGIPGRTDDACSKRYREALDPSLNRQEWTPQEDDTLLAEVARLASQWSKVGAAMRRSGLACRNRYRMLQRKRPGVAQPASPDDSPVDLPSPVHPPTPQLPPPPSLPQPAPAAPPPQQLHVPAPATRPTPAPPAEWQPHPQQETVPAWRRAEPDPPPAWRPPQEHTPVWRPQQEPAPTWRHDLEPAPVWRPPPESVPAPVPEWRPGYAFAQFVNPLAPVSPQPLAGPSRIRETPRRPVQIDPRLQSVAQPPFYQPYPSPTRPRPISRHQTPEEEETNVFYTPPAPLRSSPMDEDQDFTQLDYDEPAELYDDMQVEDDQHSPHSSPDDAAQSHPSYEDESDGEMSSLPVSSGVISVSAFPQFNTGIPKRKYVKRKRANSNDAAAGADPEDTRLSAKRNISSDAGVLAYACGHGHCWPQVEAEMASGATTSPAEVRFPNSAALLQHKRDLHGEDENEKLFRCGLAGCGKAWKNINGIQYHLQVSRAHFQVAVNNAKVQNKEQLPEEKKYRCKIAGCPNAYRQSSGLRYHMRTGHPPSLPKQLDELPPQILRKVTVPAAA